jgi:hypothetical protein
MSHPHALQGYIHKQRNYKSILNIAHCAAIKQDKTSGDYQCVGLASSESVRPICTSAQCTSARLIGQYCKQNSRSAFQICSGTCRGDSTHWAAGCKPLQVMQGMEGSCNNCSTHNYPSNPSHINPLMLPNGLCMSKHINTLVPTWTHNDATLLPRKFTGPIEILDFQ